MLPLRLLVCGKKVRMFSLCNKTNCIFITGALYAKQDSGFMDSELFLKWFQIIFLPHAKPTVENPALLLMDGHASHCSPEVIDCARENNVILLALVPHTTHLCQPLDVAVYNAFKNCLSKHVKDGQAIKGELWIPIKQVAKIITKPFEDAMSMRNIKAGFKKCGVVPYNPNAIDKERMLRNQLIPNLDVDLSLPLQNTREDAPQGQLAAALHNVPVLDLGDESEVVGVINNILDDSAVLEFEVLEDNATAVDSIPLTPSSNAPTTSHSPSASTSNITCVPSPSVSQDKEIPIKLCVTTGTREMVTSEAHSSNNETVQDFVEIYLDEYLSSHVTHVPKYKNNPLVKAGIITEDVAEVFFPPEEEIPVGRKRALRVQSKARCLTDDDVQEDLQRQRDQLKEKEERQRKRKEELEKKKNEQAKKQVKRKTAVTQPKKTNPNAKRKNAGLEDNECFSCSIPWAQERSLLKSKWVGCKGRSCPHWVCPRCLPSGFDYKDSFFCLDCID